MMKLLFAARGTLWGCWCVGVSSLATSVWWYEISCGHFCSSPCWTLCRREEGTDEYVTWQYRQQKACTTLAIFAASELECYQHNYATYRPLPQHILAPITPVINTYPPPFNTHTHTKHIPPTSIAWVVPLVFPRTATGHLLLSWRFGLPWRGLRGGGVVASTPSRAAWLGELQ